MTIISRIEKDFKQDNIKVNVIYLEFILAALIIIYSTNNYENNFIP